MKKGRQSGQSGGKMSKNQRTKPINKKSHNDEKIINEELPNSSVKNEKDPLFEDEVLDPEVTNEFLPKKRFYRIDEAANYFDVVEATIRTWISNGKLPAVKNGGGVKIPRESILKLPTRIIGFRGGPFM